MGGGTSIVGNNDLLVNYLCVKKYLRKQELRRVFRAVDRANYVLPSHREIAYDDVAWKYHNLHLSAPCVYAVSMEYLSLKPGQSFLNMGSGTGHLNTIAGLILGPYGINHGIELHQDCIDYAHDRLDYFKKHTSALEDFEFCEPSFTQGNCLRLIPSRQYDTVYCGAAVSEDDLPIVKRFVRVGGRIVLPYKGYLCCFKRLTETNWACKRCIGVSFAMLATPDPADRDSFALPESIPLSLQELCASKVRQILRKNIWIEHPDLERQHPPSSDKESGTDSTSVHSNDDLSEEDEYEDDDENDDDDDPDEDNESDEYDDEWEGHLISRTRFFFNMEIDSNETTSDLLHFRRVARLVRRRNTDGERSADDLTTATDNPSVLERNGNSSTGENHNSDARQSFIPNPSLTISQRNICDSDSDEESELGPGIRRSNKIPKRENTDNDIGNDFTEDMHFDSTNTSLESSDEPTKSDSKNVTQHRSVGNFMSEKIDLLPLPTKLKLYINRNKKLEINK